MVFDTTSHAFAKGSWDLSCKKLSKMIPRMSNKDKIDMFFSAFYHAKVDTVNYLLDNSHISVFYVDPDLNTSFYKVINNVLNDLHSCIEEGDDDAINVYNRVCQYFKI